MKKKDAPSCDWKAGGKTPAKGRSKKGSDAPSSRMMRHLADYGWRGVRTERYKQGRGDWAGVLRRTLVGEKGEHAKFHLRYFELAPGGFTSLERHVHEHVVICVRGRGRGICGRKTHEIGFLDTLYVAPDEVHRLENPYDEPFGFFCIVDAVRDRPRPA